MNQKICNIIIKMALSGESAVGALNELNVYEKEMEMYETILPQLKLLLRTVDVCGKMFADTIYVSKSHKAILLEDLSIDGYYSKNEKDGFGMAHAKAILTTLANFHAAASVLQEHQPDVYKNFKHGRSSQIDWIENCLVSHYYSECYYYYRLQDW